MALELDPGVVEVAREQLGVTPGPDLDIRTGDARTGIRSVGDDSVELVIGDAFRDGTVPWHLTTREFISGVDRVLTPDGVYVLNIIDSGDLLFARAEVATLRDRFEWVGVIATASTLENGSLGNIVAVASHRALDRDALSSAVSDQGYGVLSGSQVDSFMKDAMILTDDFAPVDRLLTRPTE